MKLGTIKPLRSLGRQWRIKCSLRVIYPPESFLLFDQNETNFAQISEVTSLKARKMLFPASTAQAYAVFDLLSTVNPDLRVAFYPIPATFYF